MYARVLTRQDESVFEKDEDQRLADIDLWDGQHAVIRLYAPRKSRDQIGLEYGAVLHRNPRTGLLTARVLFESTDEVKTVPLNVRSNGTLMSQPLGPHARRVWRVGFRSLEYPAHDGQPSRPFGYILSEEHAAKPITAAPSALHRAA